MEAQSDCRAGRSSTVARRTRSWGGIILRVWREIILVRRKIYYSPQLCNFARTFKIKIMSSLSPQQLLNALEWRYATKVFDPAKKSPADIWHALEQALVLTPTS